MNESRDSAGLVDNAAPPGRSSFRATQAHPTGNGHVNDAIDVEGIDVTGTSTKTAKDNGQVINQHPMVSATTPVYYATKEGATITQEQVVIGSDSGATVIRTPDTPAQSEERPLKAKDIRFLIIFSVVGVICLFPAGIVAVYFACRTKQEYVKGMQTADMTKAKKLAKRTEHIIIFCFIGGLVVLAIAFAVMERYIWAHDSEYWERRHHGIRGTVP